MSAMRSLYHWPLDPASRQARIALAEAKLKFKLINVNPWEPEEDFLALCAEGCPPCLVDVVAGGKAIISGAPAITEYVHDGATRYKLLPDKILERAEIRRITHWFDHKFSADVNAYILHERIEKSLAGGMPPHPPTLRTGREHLNYHLEYMTWLLERRDWMGAKTFSLADVAAGAHISCLDFLGEINWKNWLVLKSWYQKFKSRPSVRPLLADRIPGLVPPRHYADLDF